MPQGNAFITGSRAYGEPKPDSDVDLVILVTPAERDLLLQHASKATNADLQENYRPGSDTEHSFGTPMRYGKLNLLVCTEQDEYDRWLSGTETLINIKPVPRTIAVQLFESMRRKY